MLHCLFGCLIRNLLGGRNKVIIVEVFRPTVCTLRPAAQAAGASGCVRATRWAGDPRRERLTWRRWRRRGEHPSVCQEDGKKSREAIVSGRRVGVQHQLPERKVKKKKKVLSLLNDFSGHQYLRVFDLRGLMRFIR